MKLGRNSLGTSLQAGEYDWIEEFRRRGGPPGMSGDDGGDLNIAVEDDLLRTVFFTILLGGFAALGGYFSYRAASGEGLFLLAAVASLAALLACGAVVSRRRLWLRSLFILASLGVAAVVVDQGVYYRWHEQMDRVVTTLRQELASGPPAIPNRMSVRPTSLWIDPDQEIFLTFEPPPLAWMYRLDTSSSLGHTLVAGWHRVLSRLTRGGRLDSLARTIVRPHQVYSVSVRSGERTLSCQNDQAGSWTLSIETKPAGGSLQAAAARTLAGG